MRRFPFPVVLLLASQAFGAVPTTQSAAPSEVAALRAEVKSLRDQVASLKRDVESLKQLIDAGNNPPAQQREAKGAVDSIPLKGDEIPLAKIQSDGMAYSRKPVIIAGGVKVADTYDLGVPENAYIALFFEEFDKDAKAGDVARAYIPRAIGKPLVDALAEAQRGGNWQTVRLKVTYQPAVKVLTVSGWQLLAPDKKDWQPWAPR